MNWDRIERNWTQFVGTARAKWDRLTEEQLVAVAGHRDSLARSIQEAYDITLEAAQRQVDQWQGDQKAFQGDDEKGERMAGPEDQRAGPSGRP